MNKYQIIYADPPWKYESNMMNSSAIDHYETQGLDWLMSLPVKQFSAENAILFLWVTMPKLNQCFDLIKAWGFEYKTCAFVWIKTNQRKKVNQYSFLPEENFDEFMGQGRWTRGNAELCLLATRGRINRLSAGVRQIIYSPILSHSQKPNETRKRILELVGDLPRLELFARQKEAGWDVWGNEVKNDIKLDLAI